MRHLPDPWVEATLLGDLHDLIRLRDLTRAAGPRDIRVQIRGSRRQVQGRSLDNNDSQRPAGDEAGQRAG